MAKKQPTINKAELRPIEHQLAKDKDMICPEIDKAKFTAKELWYQSYKHCLNECKKCKEIDILKKILWELRKPK